MAYRHIIRFDERRPTPAGAHLVDVNHTFADGSLEKSLTDISVDDLKTQFEYGLSDRQQLTSARQWSHFCEAYLADLTEIEFDPNPEPGTAKTYDRDEKTHDQMRALISTGNPLATALFDRLNKKRRLMQAKGQVALNPFRVQEQAAAVLLGSVIAQKVLMGQKSNIETPVYFKITNQVEQPDLTNPGSDKRLAALVGRLPTRGQPDYFYDILRLSEARGPKATEVSQASNQFLIISALRLARAKYTSRRMNTTLNTAQNVELAEAAIKN